jgi:hypothetical protein
VSEKTVFNYFPTKESLLLDREEDAAEDIRRALGPEGGRVSPVEAAIGVLTRDLADLMSVFERPGGPEITEIRRFSDLVERTPSLRAAQFDMMERLAQVAAQAMADRAAVSPDDPEPQIAADALLGLWRIYWRAIGKHADGIHSSGEIRDLVIAEVRRAARLIDTGLWSFGLAVQGANGRQQLKMAADASNEARKQVLLAISQAREAWRLLKAEAHDHALSHADLETPGRGRARQGAAHHSAQQARREAHQAAQQIRRDAQQAAQQARREAQAIKQNRRQTRRG